MTKQKSMEQYYIKDTFKKLFADGILKGYEAYAQERKKKSEMKVSHGYAWTKGNQIEHAIATLIEEENKDGIFWKKTSLASWQYLQFSFEENEKKCVIVVRQGRRINSQMKDIQKHSDEGTLEASYTHQLMCAKDNKQLHKLKRKYQTSKIVQLESSPTTNNDDGIKELLLELDSADYDRIYFLAYEVDGVKHTVNKLWLTMPDPIQLDIVLVEDLTKELRTSDYYTDEPFAEATSDIFTEELSTESFAYNEIEEISEG